MNSFSPELHAKTKVDMRNMYREKHGLTRKSLMLPGLLLLSNIQTDRDYLGKRRACNNLWTKNHKSSIYDKKVNDPSKLVLSRKLPKKYQISDSSVILITRESCNSLNGWFRWRPRNQKSDSLPSPLWLNHTNICSTGRDSVIQKFFFFWTDLPPSNRFDSLWSCRFCLAYHHWKKYQHLSISSYLNKHFQHPFYLRTWQSFYLSFPAYDMQQYVICQD